MTTFATSVQLSNGLSNQEKEQKDIQIGKEKVKFSVYRWHDLISRKIPKNYTHIHTHTQIELINSAKLQDTKSKDKYQLHFSH